MNYHLAQSHSYSSVEHKCQHLNQENCDLYEINSFVKIIENSATVLGLNFVY